MHEGSVNADYLFTDLDSGSVLSVCGEHFLPALVGLVMAQCDANGTTPAEVFGWLNEPPSEPLEQIADEVITEAKAEQLATRRRAKPIDTRSDEERQVDIDA